MTSFRFQTYSSEELVTCGQEFAKHFCAVEQFAETTHRTQHIKNWFCEIAAPNATALCYNQGTGEFLVDLCHTSFPPRTEKERWIDWWNRALDGTTCMYLALESEWGKYASSTQTQTLILDDASKLALVRATVKVMIFATKSGGSHAEIVEMLRKLKSSAGDISPWLWIDLPWDRDASNKFNISWGVFIH